MGHLLSTVNPEAAERLAHPIPLPCLGQWVLYCPRPSEMRAKRPRVPALVTGVDERNELLDLLVFNDKDDLLDASNIPRRMGEDKGWEPLDGASDGGTGGLTAFKDELSDVLFGVNERHADSIQDQLNALRSDLDGLSAKLDSDAWVKKLEARMLKALEKTPGKGKR